MDSAGACRHDADTAPVFLEPLMGTWLDDWCYWFAVRVTRRLFGFSEPAARWWLMSTGLLVEVSRRCPGERLCDAIGVDTSKLDR